METLVIVVLSVAAAISAACFYVINRDASEIKRKFGTLNHLKDLVDQTQKKLDGLKDRRDEYVRAQKWLEENPKIQAEVLQLEQELREKESELVKRNKKLEEIENQITELKSVALGLKEIEGESAQAKDALNYLKDQLAASTKEVEGLKSSKDSLEKEVSTLKAEQKALDSDIVQKESRFKGLMDEVKRLEEDLKGKQEKLKIDIESLSAVEREIAEGDRLRENLTHSNAKLKEEQSALVKGTEKLRTDELLLKKSIGVLTEEVSGLESRKKGAESWLKDNASKLAHMDDLDHQITRREKDLEAVGKRIEEAGKTLDNTMKTVGQGIERLSKMNLSGVQTLRLSAFDGLRSGEGAHRMPKASDCEQAFGKDDEAVALKAVAEHFKTNGFEVPPRLLRAFHTSLKTSDMSSLTVMAGVSGTGKSAIPKLYSEAMGIFFSPLAVEPRWDSPKDLMGFFNYVTNRYEPTPLARAMFQFQGLWSEKFRPAEEMDKYMFMPMLDEMNLARIEYYFSEFLSKLELRRLTGKLTRDNVAEIALEIFPGFDGRVEGREIHEEALRLFANTNTLFVGTMNEDETTQSLSDKVIDRANVLYFGRPGKLKPQEGGLRDENAAENPVPKRHAPLELETWRTWCKTVDSGALTMASEVLSDLNAQLAEFNRPFAHRTYQAMLAYIANYPQVEGMDDNERIRFALADQIGMRIMPKLRGVELNQNHQALKSIGDILSDSRRLNDRMLNAAFESAISTEKGSGFFRWSGFDWAGDNRS